ncbi:insulinoma-associated protein 2 [Tiliqua scincoides]|uniref:insulinoma-associated protein 2 n=1 Tax=Tiliqua scincoides TaxID=71010 RepID=UPI003461AAEB
MPRGFLVKRRSRRPAAAFRLRPPGGPSAAGLEEAPRAPQPPPPPRSPPAAAWGAGPADGAAPAEPPPPPPAPPAPPPAAPRPAAPSKRPKAARRLSFADEVTTSPVLGLRIRAAAEGAAGAAGAVGGPRRGAFVCQLCREPFADPPALAQHRCSRIVRVEYRCPECQKSFSCPANLASHRRWHKPRPPAPGAPPPPPEGAPPAPPPAQEPAAPPGAPFLCPHCRRGFRRQAYLRKHLGTHRPPDGAFAAALRGPFPADARAPRPPWAPRAELLLPRAPPDGPAAAAAPEPDGRLACKRCPAAFLGPPGLACHAPKCPPAAPAADGRPLLLLQLPLRPAC